jgi:PTH1 family peptidyl-tRNA hydrolase
VRLPGRGAGRRSGRGGGPVDWLIVGLGNPGSEYAGTRHNVGFEVANELAKRWGLPKAKSRYRGLLSEGRARAAEPGGGAMAGAHAPRVAILLPQTYMNDAGQSVGPARGAFEVPLERVLVIHDEIDLPFGEIRTRTGGGLAGHNGLKSLRQALGSPGFSRIRIGVGRPPTTDPERVAAYVLSRFREPREEVALLVERAADEAESVVLGGAGADQDR